MADRYRNSAKKKRNQQLILIYVIVTIFAAAAIALFIMNTKSDKGKFRELGIEAFKKGAYEEAAGHFEKSLEENQWFTGQTDVDTRMYLGACYLRLNRYSDAAACYRLAGEKNSGTIDDNLLTSLLETADAMNEVDELRSMPKVEADTAQLEKVAESQPYMYLCLASYYIERKDDEKALAALTAYSKVRPMNTYVAYELSAAYIRQEKYTEAASIIEQGLSSGDKNYADLLRFNQIVLTEAKGDYESAFKSIEELCKEYPDNTMMKKEYDFLYTRVNPNTTPVNPYSDARTDEENAAIARELSTATAENNDGTDDAGNGDAGSDDDSDSGSDDGSAEGTDAGENTDEGYDGGNVEEE